MSSAELSRICLASTAHHTAAVSAFVERTSPRVGLDRFVASFKKAICRCVHRVGKFENELEILHGMFRKFTTRVPAYPSFATNTLYLYLVNLLF